MQELKDFIAEMVEIRNEVTYSDLQAIVEAYVMQYGGDENEILQEIEKRV